MNKNLIITGLAIIVVVFGVLLLQQQPLGAQPGPTHTNAEFFLDTVSFSGAVTNSATLAQSGAATFTGTTRIYAPINTGAIVVLSGAATSSITAAQACAGVVAYASSSIIEASTLTLPTAEAMFAACLTTNGDAVTMFARNMTASTTVITAGSASTTIAIDNGGTVTLGALGTTRITFKRLANNLMYAFVSVFKP